MVRVIFAVFLGSFLLLSKLNAANPITLTGKNQTIYVKDMGQYIDSSSSLTYNDFQFNRNKFFKPKYTLQGTRNRDFTYWLTFALEGEVLKNDKYYLICIDSRISHLEVWIDGIPQSDQPMGTDYLFHNRKINSRYFVFELPENDKVEVVVRARSNQASFFAFEVKEENRFLGNFTWETGALGGTYGIFILAMLFSATMRIRFKDSIYEAFIFFVVIAFFACLFLDGSGFQYYWSGVPSINLYLLMFLPFGISVSCAAIVISFLEVWDLKNKYFRLIAWSISSVVIGYIFAFTIPQYYIHNLFYMIPFGFMIYACVDNYIAGNKSMLAFIIGFVFVISANSLYMLQPFMSVEYYNYLIRLSPHFSVAALIVALSYSQYAKFYNIYRSREAERKKSIVNLEQLSRIKDRINQEIAEKVALQTKELEQKNSIIHQQNAELQHANDKLKEQTDEIVILNLKLNQENQELKSDVEKINESRILQNTISFDDFRKFFDSDDSCYAMLEGLKWQNGFECVKCGNIKYGKGKGERARRCTKCGINESVTVNTIFHRIHFPILKGFYMLFLVNKHGDNLISKDLSEIVDLRLATCWKFSKKIKAKKLEMEQSGKVIESWLDLI